VACSCMQGHTIIGIFTGMTAAQRKCTALSASLSPTAQRCCSRARCGIPSATKLIHSSGLQHKNLRFTPLCLPTCRCSAKEPQHLTRDRPPRSQQYFVQARMVPHTKVV
jgi:hypothetical protein